MVCVWLVLPPNSYLVGKLMELHGDVGAVETGASVLQIDLIFILYRQVAVQEVKDFKEPAPLEAV